jgi:hypothetical protein
MRNFDGRAVGILGTVIIHLIAAILFMSFKIKSLSDNFSEIFAVEFAPADNYEIMQEAIELPSTSIENILKGDEEMLNIARNLANRPDEQIDPADYIDKVKEELIKSGLLGSDNYIDEQKRLQEAGEQDNMALNNEVSEKPEETDPKESQEMAANYQGPTRIFYNLSGRNHLHLPIPIYKCKGSGKVMLAISVNQRGLVESAAVIASESNTTDVCLTETAIRSALASRFNPDLKSPKEQPGTLTYLFVAQ